MTRASLRIAPSVSEFPDRRRDHLLYVDKTSQIASFLRHDKAQLFTRPRRFGKSLLLSTIEAMYSGNRDLFAGDSVNSELAVYQDVTWVWRERTVLRLDMQAISDKGAGIVPALSYLVEAVATDLKMQGQYTHRHDHPAFSLRNLIAALCERSATTLGVPRIVILVDEYDAPILNHMHMPQGGDARRELAEFYGVFKWMQARIETLVMTGVTRFVKTGLWFKLNQIQDQTDNPRFHDLTGFTDAELDVLWAQVKGKIRAIPPQAGLPCLSRNAWREWYNGYRFALRDVEPIYNPYAIMCSLAQGEIGEYWSQTGHLGVVEALLQAPWTQTEPQDRVPLYLTRPVPVDDYQLHFDWLDDLKPGKSPEAMLQQWEPTQLVPLLYQTGYLTLTGSHTLAPPNREIATYLSHVLLKPWLGPVERQRASLYQARLLQALLDLQIPDLVTHLNALMHLIPHQRFHGAARIACNLVLDLAVLLSRGRIRYHGMEHSGLQGDSDTTLVWDDISLVIEFKTGHRESAESGQKQIEDHSYLRALLYVSRLYLGLSLHTTGRQIDAWKLQGYSLLGKPVGKALTHETPWPTGKGILHQRWATDSEDFAAKNSGTGEII